MKYRNASAPLKERVEDLLGRMTREEKIGQLCQPFGWHSYRKNGEGGVEVTESFRREIAGRGIGSLYGTLRADPWTEVTLETGLSPGQGAEAVNVIQKYAIENSRLGIPILFGEECSHGHMAIGATVFPVPLAIGSTWNVELYRRMCRAVALETRAQGGAATYSPVLDVVRDPRWGRTEECFGEDPYLIGEFAVAAVEGLQGDSPDGTDSVMATLKHFAGYGFSEGGRNAGPAHMGMRELHDVDLYPFKKAVEAGALSVMTAYNEIDGVPCTSSSYLLREVLREQWGFDGFVITDCGAIDMLASGHDVAEDGGHAAALALKAGVDMEMSGRFFGDYLAGELEGGRLSEAELNEAVGRILSVKFRLGLFERPYVDPERAALVVGSREHAELARQIAREGTVLLKNEAGTLPFDSRTVGTVAMIGPNADNVYNQLGDYTSPQPRGKVATLLEGIREKLGPERVRYAPGCRVTGGNRDGFESALECADAADVVVLALGSSSARDFGEGTIDLRTGASVVRADAESDMDCGEGVDRTRLSLSGVQLELMQAIRALGKPIVVVYVNGRPIAEPWVDEHADAILEAWYPGQEGGRAIADILFGEANPSGKLTVSVPKETGQLPVHYNGKRSRGKRYLETDLKPRYPFGFGLSYTEFVYSDLQAGSWKEEDDGAFRARLSVRVTNAGGTAGAETVQLYVKDDVSSVARPVKELKGFHKIWLEPGEAREVEFIIEREHLMFTGQHYRLVLEPGTFTLTVARHSDDSDGLSATIVVEDEGGGR
ncbi:glycoside hydrolase family 3 N-terminal domain-containing protein [Cohnella faecalis]|uniref:Beta-glucosidase n=1 Tax=Cohnella faecalis TaxID=2315694 RepID=A0A398CGY3_9BACL|nr:glycoside hydrolase family 3 N-terminal domain-containing protein [Cohnella faecalis]RIE00339.1 beta-glucosidase [Cohnella faecalis]